MKIEIALYGCQGPLVLTESRIIFPPDFTILNVARGISQVNRFTGQTAWPFSVAEHSVNLLHLATDRCPKIAPSLRKAILLHDGPEGLGINDLNTHIKRALAPEVRKMELRINEALWSLYGLEKDVFDWEDMESLLKPWDSEIGSIEYEAIFCGRFSLYGPRYLTPREAQKQWLQEWFSC